MAAESKQLEVERQRTYDVEKELSQVKLELNVCKEQRDSEVSGLQSRLKTETEAAKELEAKLRNDIRVCITFQAKATTNEIESGIPGGTFQSQI